MSETQPVSDAITVTLDPSVAEVVVTFRFAVRALSLDETAARELARLLLEAADDLKRRLA